MMRGSSSVSCATMAAEMVCSSSNDVLRASAAAAAAAVAAAGVDTCGLPRSTLRRQRGNARLHVWPGPAEVGGLARWARNARLPANRWERQHPARTCWWPAGPARAETARPGPRVRSPAPRWRSPAAHPPPPRAARLFATASPRTRSPRRTQTRPSHPAWERLRAQRACRGRTCEGAGRHGRSSSRRERERGRGAQAHAPGGSPQATGAARPSAPGTWTAPTLKPTARPRPWTEPPEAWTPAPHMAPRAHATAHPPHGACAFTFKPRQRLSAPCWHEEEGTACGVHRPIPPRAPVRAPPPAAP